MFVSVFEDVPLSVDFGLFAGKDLVKDISNFFVGFLTSNRRRFALDRRLLLEVEYSKSLSCLLLLLSQLFSLTYLHRFPNLGPLTDCPGRKCIHPLKHITQRQTLPLDRGKHALVPFRLAVLELLRRLAVSRSMFNFAAK